MKTISIINLKGGVAKTLTADSMAHVLATLHNKRVLLVDNDKQGNTSKAFGVHSYDDKSISDVLTARRLDPREVIKKTRFENIDVMPANMTLIRANMEVLMDSTRPQQTRLRSALNAIAEENFYDFCIIDNAPDINISTINALVASDDVIIPIKIDKYAFDGLEELKEQIEDTRDDLNPRLRLAGCLITCFIRADAEKQGEAWLRSRPEYPVFDTRIRYSDKVTESTFSEIPIVEYSRRSGTAMDYIAFVREYLRRGQKVKNCNYCEHLNLTEEQQHKAGTDKPHICLKYGKRVFHRSTERGYHEMIYPCRECENESLSESDGKGAIYGKI